MYLKSRIAGASNGTIWLWQHHSLNMGDRQFIASL